MKDRIIKKKKKWYEALIDSSIEFDTNEMLG